MNEYELIGRFADLDGRLRKIEGREPIQADNQPAPQPQLCEVVEKFLLDYAQCAYPIMRQSLTAERKRRELVGNCIDAYERLLKEITRDECKHPNADSFNGCYLCNAVGDAKIAKHRLDAFEKEQK